VLHLKHQDFSRDPQAVQAMNDDPLNDLGKEAVIADIKGWINSHAPVV
jgi:hypothetical protein